MNSPLSNMCIAQTHSSFTHFSETVMTYPPGCFLDCTTSSLVQSSLVLKVRYVTSATVCHNR